MAEQYTFAARKDLVPAVVRAITDRLQKGIDRDGRAGLVLTGGNTPKLVYPKLSQAKLPWEKVLVTLSDERMVARTHPASNEGMLRRTLFDNEAGRAEFLSLLSRGKTPAESEALVEERLEAMPWPTAVTLLGMGADGHIASLFSQDPTLDKALDRETEKLVKACLLPNPPEDAPYHRMTLTLPALLRTEQIILLITGEEKRDTLSDAFLNKDQEREMPVRALLSQSRVPVDIYWSP